MLEQRGVPTAVMGTFEFEPLARLEAKNRGIEALPLALVPHPLGGIHEDEVVRKADLALEAVLKALTHLMSDPGPAAITFAFPARTTTSTRYYQERGWTDGLPIVPPTEARVRSSCAGPIANRGRSWASCRRGRARPRSRRSRSTP